MKICNMSLRLRRHQEGSHTELGCSARLGQEEDSAFQLSRITERSNVGMPLQRAALSPVGPGSQGLNTPVTPKTFALELSLGKPTLALRRQLAAEQILVADPTAGEQEASSPGEMYGRSSCCCIARSCRAGAPAGKTNLPDPLTYKHSSAQTKCC